MICDATRTTERRQLTMHSKLLMDVIKRQAGTLAKAIIEGVMNSIEAKATKCVVTMDRSTVKVDDDGAGIMKREHIEKFFETFGQPHDESEGKIYAQFRMGRGQMFAFGRNTWRTGPFSMVVDIEKMGLEYELDSSLKKMNGCSILIQLYSELSHTTMADTERALEEWVKYAPIPVFLNGKRLSRDPAKEKWDHVTDDAYMRLDRDKGSLAVYNLGIHTMDVSSHRFGVGGVIVSRKQLKVNFARNDIQSDCKVWQRLRPFLDKESGRIIEKRATLNDAERAMLCERVKRGNYPPNVKNLKLFTSVSNRHYSAEQIKNEVDGYYKKGRVTHAPSGNRQGDKIMQHKIAFVFSTQTLARFGYSKVKPMMEIINKILATANPEYYDSTRVWYKAVKFASLAKTINNKFDLLVDSELTEIELIWKDLARFAGTWLFSGSKDRKVVVGVSATANAWTDGSTYVALGRDWLKTLDFTVQGVTRFAHTLLHERCHDESDAVDHDHGPEFYQAFHDYGRDTLPMIVDKMIGRLPQIFHAHGRRMTRRALRDQDRIYDVNRALEAMVKKFKAKELECESKA